MTAETQQTVSRIGVDDIGTLTQVMGVVDELRSRNKAIELVLNSDQVKDSIKEKLRKYYSNNAIKVTEDQLDAAVSRHFDSLYDFKEPKVDLGIKLANSYVERGRIFRQRVVPVVVFGAIAGLAYGGVKLARAAYLHSAEVSVEEAVEEGHRRQIELTDRYHALGHSAIRRDLPQNENNVVEQVALGGSHNLLERNEAFFRKYCDGGTADDDVTLTNYTKVRSALNIVESNFRDVEGALVVGENILKKQVRFGEMKRDLDSLVGEIRRVRPEPPQVLVQQAENFYHAGITDIQNRDLDQANNHLGALRTLRQDIQEFPRLTASLDRIYHSAKSIAREDAAVRQADGTYTEARGYIESANIGQLRHSIERLNNMDTVLRQEYTIRIVDRPGQRSGQDRIYTDKNGRRVSGYYLIVEAVDANENPIPMNITSEEDHRNYPNRTMWGERVENRIFEEVKADKRADGRVDNGQFGRKRIGYLNPEVGFYGMTRSLGRITSW